MVSRKHNELTSRRTSWIAAIAVCGALCQQGFGADQGRKFYSDDPLWKEPAPRPVREVAKRSVDHIYDFVYGSYVTPRMEGKIAKRAPRPALDVNTLGEVPDGAWYTNRHRVRRMSIDELRRGPGNSTPPDPDRPWRITSAKSDGVTPGFVIEDSRRNRYVLKFDPPQFPELCSAADVIGSKIFYALGFQTPENYIVHFRRDQLEIGEGVTYRHPSGKKVPLTGIIVDGLLKSQPRLADGAYRALASRWLEGTVIGPFDYRGTRSDDPNDTIPHEDRRVLRGLAVFAAWVNHHDTSQINTMDTLVTQDGYQYIRHNLIDFGSILGSRGDREKDPWVGHQYSVMHTETALRALTLGLYVTSWERSYYPRLKGVGLLDSRSFDPIRWRPEVPNPAFLMMDKADAFWAAKQVAAFTDDEIKAMAETGGYSDKRATDWVAGCLIKRRDMIARAWFAKVLPLDNFRASQGRLEWTDLLAAYGLGPALEPRIHWEAFDNERQTSAELPGENSARLPEMRGDGYWKAVLEVPGRPGQSVHVYVRKSGDELTVVGIDRF